MNPKDMLIAELKQRIAELEDELAERDRMLRVVGRRETGVTNMPEGEEWFFTPGSEDEVTRWLADLRARAEEGCGT